ncbi:MAG: CRISPR-associated protein Csx20 [Promethearchaeota archaeon]
MNGAGEKKRGRRMLVLLNHELTAQQREDARASLGVGQFVFPPEDLRHAWANVPPDVERLDDYLAPLLAWLEGNSNAGDLLLVQGEFGATYHVVRFARSRGLRPVYSTTRRQAVDVVGPDGTVTTRREFRHVRFRLYDAGQESES